MKFRLIGPLLALSVFGFGCSPVPATQATPEPPAVRNLYAASLAGDLDGKELRLDFVRAFESIRGSFELDGTTGHVFSTATSSGAFKLTLYKKAWEDVGTITGDWSGERFIGTYQSEHGASTTVTLTPREDKDAVAFEVLGTQKKDNRMNGEERCMFSLAYPVIKNHDAANETIREAFDIANKSPEAQQTDFIDICHSEIGDLESDTSTADYAQNMLYDSQTTFSVELNRAGLLSLVVDTYLFTGGAHGMPGIAGLTMDVESGKKLALGDLVKRDSLKPLIQKVRARVLKEYADALFEEPLAEFRKFTADKKPASETELVTFAGLESFYLTPNGFVFYWNVYEISPYAAGQLTVEIPIEDIKEMLREDSAITSLLK